MMAKVMKEFDRAMIAKGAMARAGRSLAELRLRKQMKSVSKNQTARRRTVDAFNVPVARVD